MAAVKSVSFKVFGPDGSELRTITVEVEEGKKLKKRAEAEALKLITEEETIQMVQNNEPKDDDKDGDELEDKKTGSKFTFEFEIYHNGVLKRTQEISAISETEDGALDASVAALKEELTSDESFRYTNKFRKEALTSNE